MTILVYNQSTCSTGGVLMIRLYNGLERKYMFSMIVVKGRLLYVIRKILVIQEATVMTRLENGLERSNRVYFLLWEDVGVLQKPLKIKGQINGKCSNSGMAHLTQVCELCGCLR